VLTQAFNLSGCTVLRFVEVPIFALPSARQLLSTVTSQAFSEIVIVISEDEVHSLSRRLPFIVREVHKVKEFRVAFCLEALEESREAGLSTLTLETEAAVAAGLYFFLPCPPSVFSRTVVGCDRRYPHY
jgi:hypothetical protein